MLKCAQGLYSGSAATSIAMAVQSATRIIVWVPVCLVDRYYLARAPCKLQLALSLEGAKLAWAHPL